MKRVLLAAALGLILIGCDESTSPSTPSAPQVKEAIPAPAATMPATTQASASASASATTIANAMCPVGGEKVDPKGKTVSYEGKTIGFCCDECIESFQKEPAKYAANLK